MRLNLHDLKAILVIPIVMGVIMTGVAWLSNESILGWAFGGMICLFLVVIFLLSLVRADENHCYSMAETLATAALGWALVGLLGGISFYIAAYLVPDNTAVVLFQAPLNCLFESVSGFTSTGLTVIKDPSALPATLQFWRSFMEWIGGAGLALLMMTILNPSSDGGDLFNAEISKSFTGDVRRTAKDIWWIYIVLSLLSMGLFAVLGMPLWESINHGMTAISTGGFTITRESFGHYKTSLQIAAIAIMTLGAISFAAYHQLVVKRDFFSFCRRGPILFLIIGIFIISFLLWQYQRVFDVDDAYTRILFQAASSFTTSGFTVTTLDDWQPTTLILLLIGMFIGGASGATTGGVKIDRILLLLRSIGWRFERLFKGKIEREVVVDDQSLPIEQARLQVEGAATLIALWLVTGMVGCLIMVPICIDEWSFMQILFEVMSALGSVGLSTGIVSSELSAAGKGTIIVLMWMGRLELIAAFALLLLPMARKSG